jgi:tetratricopeptide (TPR) repeat protein
MRRNRFGWLVRGAAVTAAAALVTSGSPSATAFPVAPAPRPEPTAALEDAMRTLSKKPDDLTALRTAAQACLDLGRPDDAHRYASASVGGPGKADATSWVLLARAYLARGDALPENDNDAANFYDEGRSKAQEALRLDPAVKGARAVVARAYRLMKQDPQAEKAIAEALQADPKDAESLFEQGEFLLIRKKEYAGAVGAFKASVAADPTRPLSYLRLGLASAYTKAFPAACDAFVRAAVLAPRDTTALKQIVKYSPDGADAYLRTVVKESDDATWAHAYLAWWMAVKGNPGEAKKAMANASALQPKNAMLKAFFSDVWSRMGDPAQAEKAAREALKDAPHADVAWNYLYAEAFSPKSSRNVKDRAELGDFLVRVRPDSAMAWNNLGLFHRDVTRDYRKALAAYLKAAELAPDDDGIQNDTGLIYHYHGASINEDPRKARPFYERAVEIIESQDLPEKPMGYWDAVENLAKYYSGKGMEQSVEENPELAMHYAKLRLDPDARANGRAYPSGSAGRILDWARSKLDKK